MQATGSLLTVDPKTQNGTDIVKTDFVIASLNTVISKSWLNELRGQIGRDNEEQIPNVTGLPQTGVTGGITFGMPQFLPRPAYPHEQRYQVLDNLTFYRGNHTVKTGLDINLVREQLINLFNGGGTYSYPSLDAIAADCPSAAVGCVPTPSGSSTGLHYSNYTQAFDLNGQRGAINFSEWTYAFFVQDSWRVNGKLLVNAGLRWDYQRLPEPGKVVTTGVTFAGNPLLAETTHFHQDLKDWAPRLGATYDIGSTHDTVLRASYGMFYALTSNSAVQDALINNGVNQASYNFTPSTAGAPAYPTVLTAPPTGVAGNKPDVHFFSSDLVRPRVHSVDVTLDKNVPGNITASASYLFSRGHDFPYFRDINLPPATASVAYLVDGQNVGSYPFYRGTRPNANFGRMIVMEPAVTTNYHALVLSATKRLSQGLMFNSSYTLSKAEDNGQSSTTFFSSSGIPYDSLNFRNPNNPIDSALSPANYDRRHRFVGSFFYQLAYFWDLGLGGIVTLESGLPLSQKTTGNVAASTGAVNTTGTNGTGGFFGAPWVGYNTDRQSGRKTFDARISRDFHVSGSRRVQVLWEVFNVFNAANYTNYFDTAFDVVTSSYDANTNVTTVTLRKNTGYLLPRSDTTNFWGPRDMQLGIKLLW